MEEQVTKVVEVIITNSNLLLVHFGGLNNDRLVLKQWKGVLNRIMSSSNMIGTLWSEDSEGNGNVEKAIGLIISPEYP